MTRSQQKRRKRSYSSKHNLKQKPLPRRFRPLSSADCTQRGTDPARTRTRSNNKRRKDEKQHCHFTHVPIHTQGYMLSLKEEYMKSVVKLDTEGTVRHVLNGSEVGSALLLFYALRG